MDFHSSPIKTPVWLGPELVRWLSRPWEQGGALQDDLPLLYGYVERGGTLIKAVTRRALRQRLEAVRTKMSILRRCGREKDADRLQFLARFFTSSASTGPRSALLRRCVNETAFALIYFYFDEDLQPDDLPGDGFSDDAAVVVAVFQRNRVVLQEFCKFIGVDWEEISPENADTQLRSLDGSGVMPVSNRHSFPR